jgi:hypothetical protein
MTEQDQRRLGTAALEAGRWEEARAAFAAALAERETPEALDGMGVALWWLGDTRASIAHTERAYAGFRRASDAVAAAMAAMSLCVTWISNFDNHAAAGGWLARAERVLGDLDPRSRAGCGCCAGTWSPTPAGPASSSSGCWSWPGPPATPTSSCAPLAISA